VAAGNFREPKATRGCWWRGRPIYGALQGSHAHAAGSTGPCRASAATDVDRRRLKTGGRRARLTDTSSPSSTIRPGA